MADIIAEMSGKTSARFERERQQAQKTAREERIDDDAEIAKRSAIAVLDERDRRDLKWFDTHLGSLTPAQYRQYCRERFGFDPGV
jgi:hypothetical protein